MAPNYKTNDPKGWQGDIKRGAALGRPSITKLDRNAVVRLYLRKVRLVDGYDTNGTYFGSGRPLYWVANDSGEVDFMIRANDREEAREQVKELYPNAKFFR